MLIERAPSRSRSHHIPRWLKIAAVSTLGVLIAGIVVLATHWPFNRETITRALEAATSRPVEIETVRKSYFPPGCMAEKVRVLHNSDRSAPPLITIEKVWVRGSLLGLLFSPKRLAEVKLVGMRLRIPSEGAGGPVALNSGEGGKAVVISKIVADGALLEFVPAEKGSTPFRLGIDGLIIRDVGAGKPMSFQTILTNSEPPGVIKAQGQFGPWDPRNVNRIPVSGDFLYENADLGVFKGISGKLQAKGRFEGPLAKIRAEGSAEIPDFHVANSGTVLRLAVDFHALVNGTNGNTYLEPANARFLRTPVETRGAIEDRPGEKGKTASLDLAIRNGRIDDVLRLFVRDKTAPLSGALNLDARVVWPPGPLEFVRKIRVDIDFGVAKGKFASRDTQQTIDRLSKSAQGESKKEENEDPRTMLSDLRGRVSFRSGIATFENVSFRVPGAWASIRGTYGLVDQRVDLHGVLHTPGKLSDTTSGIKALLVKVITPFFKKQNHVKVVPFKITGTFDNASVSLD